MCQRVFLNAILDRFGSSISSGKLFNNCTAFCAQSSLLQEDFPLWSILRKEAPHWFFDFTSIQKALFVRFIFAIWLIGVAPGHQRSCRSPCLWLLISILFVGFWFTTLLCLLQPVNQFVGALAPDWCSVSNSATDQCPNKFITHPKVWPDSPNNLNRTIKVS